jgi:hypothetical protein
MVYNHVSATVEASIDRLPTPILSKLVLTAFTDMIVAGT